MEKITLRKQLHSALWIMECPKCKEVLASASEPQYLPEFTTCSSCSGKKKRILRNIKNLKQFKEALKVGTKVETIYFLKKLKGGTIEVSLGEREVIKNTSKYIYFRNYSHTKDCFEESCLLIPKANQCDFNGNEVIIYSDKNKTRKMLIYKFI